MDLLTRVLWFFWLLQIMIINSVMSYSNYDYNSNDNDDDGQELHQSEPDFKINPVDVAILEGEVAVFNCVFVNLQGNELIFWTKDGDNLSDNLVEHPNIRIFRDFKEGNFTLVIERAKFEDEGHYQCHLMSRDGRDDFLTMDSDVGKLTVEELPTPPIIVQGSRKSRIEAKEGEIIELDCSCTGGKPVPKIIWRNGNGKKISRAVNETEVISKSEYLFSDETVVRVKNVTRSILTYEVIRKNLEGKEIIMCQVKSKLKSTNNVHIMNTTIEINIIPSPKLEMKIKSQNSQNQNKAGKNESSIVEFDDIVISCKVISEDPHEFKFNWFLNFTLIDVVMENNCKKYRWNMSDENRTMHIYMDKITRRFHGSSFQCQVSNDKVNMEALKMLYIKYDPTVMKLPERIISDKHIGDDLELNCTIELAELICKGQPEFLPSSNITWYHEDVFGSPPRLIATSTDILIMNIENNTFGDYECVFHYPGYVDVISKIRIPFNSSVKSDDQEVHVGKPDFQQTTLVSDLLEMTFTTVFPETTPEATDLQETTFFTNFKSDKIKATDEDEDEQEVDPGLYVGITVGVIIILVLLALVVYIYIVVFKCKKGFCPFCKAQNLDRETENSTEDNAS